MFEIPGTPMTSPNDHLQGMRMSVDYRVRSTRENETEESEADEQYKQRARLRFEIIP